MGDDRERLLEFFHKLQTTPSAWAEFRQSPKEYVQNSRLSVDLQLLVQKGEVEEVLEILNGTGDHDLNNPRTMFIIW